MDWSAIIVAGLSLVGTLFGSIIGIMTANRLTTYRIEQLEKKVDAHNKLADRVTILEEHDKENAKDLNEVFGRVRILEKLDGIKNAGTQPL